MGYIICNKCGGYYELQEGESLSDFDSCECGGQLKYTEKVNTSIKSNADIYCPECGKKNLVSAQYCENCGKQLKLLRNEKNRESKGKTNKFIIKSVVYLAFGSIVLIVFLASIAYLYESSILLSLIFFSVIVAMFLILRYLLDKFLG